jgi:hypothetical protein
MHVPPSGKLAHVLYSNSISPITPVLLCIKSWRHVNHTSKHTSWMLLPLLLLLLLAPRPSVACKQVCAAASAPPGRPCSSTCVTAASRSTSEDRAWWVSATTRVRHPTAQCSKLQQATSAVCRRRGQFKKPPCKRKQHPMLRFHFFVNTSRDQASPCGPAACAHAAPACHQLLLTGPCKVGAAGVVAAAAHRQRGSQAVQQYQNVLRHTMVGGVKAHEVSLIVTHTPLP